MPATSFFLCYLNRLEQFPDFLFLSNQNLVFQLMSVY